MIFLLNGKMFKVKVKIHIIIIVSLKIKLMYNLNILKYLVFINFL